jgi:hypothetical protein
MALMCLRLHTCFMLAVCCVPASVICSVVLREQVGTQVLVMLIPSCPASSTLLQIGFPAAIFWEYILPNHPNVTEQVGACGACLPTT